jgi:ABC-type molybdate transport system substrate-binding protein
MEAGIIDQIVHRQEFSGVHLATITTGSGVTALGRGDADMALQVTPEITSRKDVELVGALPPELAAHIDVDAAVANKATDLKAALDFVSYITSTQAIEHRAQSLGVLLSN